MSDEGQHGVRRGGAAAANWHAWRWLWEYIGVAYMRDELTAGRVSYWWSGYLNHAGRWAAVLLGPEHWTPPEYEPPIDAWAYKLGGNWRDPGPLAP